MELEKREELQGDPHLPPHPHLINSYIRAEQGGSVRETRIPTVEKRSGEKKDKKEGQRRTTHQFVFIEKLDEWGGDESVESLQEGIYLRLYGSCHPQLCHQLYILGLRHREITHTRAYTAWSKIIKDMDGGWHYYYIVIVCYPSYAALFLAKQCHLQDFGSTAHFNYDSRRLKATEKESIDHKKPTMIEWSTY